MKNIATNITQSKQLLSNGFSPDTADMVWEPWPGGTHHLAVHDTTKPFYQSETPAWSVNALFDLLPSSIDVHVNGTETYSLRIGKDLEHAYVSYYKPYPPLQGDWLSKSVVNDGCTDLLDCIVQMLLELCDKGFLVNSKELNIEELTMEEEAKALIDKALCGDFDLDAIKELGKKYQYHNPELNQGDTV
jgi:hypothetical protein